MAYLPLFWISCSFVHGLHEGPADPANIKNDRKDFNTKML